jgi:hypothetical protein
MQHYTHIARFTTVVDLYVDRNVMKIFISKFSFLQFPFTYSLSQKILKSHVII